MGTGEGSFEMPPKCCDLSGGEFDVFDIHIRRLVSREFRCNSLYVWINNIHSYNFSGPRSNRRDRFVYI